MQGDQQSLAGLTTQCPARVKGSGESAAFAASPGWSLLREEVSLPAAVLYQSRLENNLHWMQHFAQRHRVNLAPHGKTTMAPALFAQQLNAGAWGITLATATQAAVAYQHGVRRVLLANQLVGLQNMAIISELLCDNTFDFYCLVDSAANVQALSHFFRARGQCVQVLIEIGVNGGRCGTRSRRDVSALVAAIATAPGVALCGVETYEGVIHGERVAERVREHAEVVRDICLELLDERAFAERPVVLTGAGSAWYDIVAQVFGAVQHERIVPVIRPGCYIVHDQGLCMHNQHKLLARCAAHEPLQGDLQSAMEIWACVQSIPEPGLAIIGMGKRDVAFDAGLPVPALHFRPGQGAAMPRPAPGHWQVQSMMDQHAAMRFLPSDNVRVGDIVAFGTSHPCLTFDKWQQMCVIDDEYTVVDLVRTFF